MDAFFVNAVCPLFGGQKAEEVPENVCFSEVEVEMAACFLFAKKNELVALLLNTSSNGSLSKYWRLWSLRDARVNLACWVLTFLESAPR